MTLHLVYLCWQSVWDCSTLVGRSVWEYQTVRYASLPSEPSVPGKSGSPNSSIDDPTNWCKTIHFSIIYELERVGCPQPQSCPPAWEQDEMLINEWGKCDITSYYLHVKSGDDSLNGIAVISRTIFVENWLWRPSCFSEIAEIQYQPSLCHLISV